ncbi:hypothetical protein PIROE2DRAFT_14023, partial [Piromyces sp. E2]
MYSLNETNNNYLTKNQLSYNHLIHENNKLLKIRAFEILSKVRHIKGLEKLEEKDFLDITLNTSKEIKAQNKKITNIIPTKNKNIKQGKTKLINKKNGNNTNINMNNGFNDNNKLFKEENVTDKIKTISEKDYEEDENNLLVSPKLMEVILNLFSTIFWKLNVKSFQSLKEDRKNEKKIDLQHNILASEKRDHEIAFQMVFKSLVKKELKNQGYLCKKGFDIFNGNDCLDALDFLITLLNPSTKIVLNNIFDIQNKNMIEKEFQINTSNKILNEVKKKISVVTFNDKVEENVIYDDSFEIYDKDNDFLDTKQEHDPINKNVKTNDNDNSNDILPLTPIPEKRIKKYGQYDNLDIAYLHDKEIIKKLKKEIEILKNENLKLTNENKKIKLLLKDITSENGKQSTDIKRMAILKSQIIQLKRQVVSQEKIINEKVSYIDDIKNTADNISLNLLDIEKNNNLDENSKYILCQLKESLVKINESINNSKYLNYLDKNSNSIFNNDNDNNIDHNNIKNEFIFYSDFISSTTRPKKQISIFDICSGNLDHLNIKHIGRLETKLHQLYIDLISIYTYFDSFFNPKLDLILKNDAKKKYEKAILSLNDTINYLLPLSVLIPSVLKPGMPVIPTSDDIIKRLSLPTNFDKTELKSTINNLIKGFKIYQDIITEEKESYKNIFSEYKSNFDNICQSVRNEIVNYEKKYKTIGNTIINIKYPIDNVYQSLQSLKSNFNTDNLISYLKLTEKELTKGSSPLINWKINGSKSNIEKIYNKDVKGFSYNLKNNAYISLPKENRQSCYLIHPFLVLQIYVPSESQFTLECGITDIGCNKERIVLSTSIKSIKYSSFHISLPLTVMKRDV